MNALWWLVLCALVRGGRGEVCSGTVFSTSGNILGAQCPTTSTPYGELSFMTCASGQIMTNWQIFRIQTYVIRMDFTCCQAGKKFYGDDKGLCSDKTFQLQEYSGFISSSKSGSSKMYCIDIYSAPNTPGWGFNSFATAWNAYGLVGLRLKTAVGNIITEYAGPVVLPDTIWRSYECPSGFSIIGVYYKSGIKVGTTWNLFSDFGFQCMPLECPVAKYPSASASDCLDCPVGTYNSQSFATSCTPCTNANTDKDPASITYTSSGGASDTCSYKCNSGYGGGGTSVSTCGTGCCRCIEGYFSVSPNTCTACYPGTVSGSKGSATCTACVAGSTYMAASAGTVCLQCSAISATPGFYKIICTAVKNTETLPCTACTAGYELSPSCNTGVNTGQIPGCVQCPAGKIQANAIPLGAATSPTCTFCGAGSFQPSPAMSRCSNCNNLAPANGAYADWTSLSLDGNNCPIKCNAGFGWNVSTCSQCGLGKFGTGGLVGTPASTCQSCQLLTNNGYWLNPVTFNRSWPGCPWDCNAGYQKTTSGNCAPCNAGYYSSNLRSKDNDSPNTCQVCAVCAQTLFSSSRCNASRNTICSPCLTSCNYGSYVKTQCNSTTNNMCVPCRTCSEGKYMTGVCTGQVRFMF